MEDLKNKLASLGLTGEQVQGAIPLILGFIKNKLPHGVFELIEGHLMSPTQHGNTNQNAATQDGTVAQTGEHNPHTDLGGLLGTIGGLLGK